MASLPILACRGQNIRLRPRQLVAAASAKPSSVPVISGKYIVPDCFDNSGTVIGGATFEYCDEEVQDVRDFASGIMPPDLKFAVRELTDPLQTISPMLWDLWEPVEAICGVRALPPRSALGSVPLAGRIQGTPAGKEAWVFTGLGSRGLLHHAYVGREIARAAVSSRDDHINDNARRVPLLYSELSGAFDSDTMYRLPTGLANKAREHAPADALQ